ncbi:hypothetical protein ACO2CR_06915 [Aeromonas caviae]
MSFDIHDNPLRHGHCEVHPHVHEVYPCSVCLAEKQRNQSLRPGADYDPLLEIAVLTNQCDELLAELKEVHRIASGSNMTHNMMVIRDRCADAIAKFKVKGDAT